MTMKPYFWIKVLVYLSTFLFLITIVIVSTSYGNLSDVLILFLLLMFIFILIGAIFGLILTLFPSLRKEPHFSFFFLLTQSL